MGAPAGGAGGEAAGFASFIPLILMFAVFYFLLIRPQQKRAKEHKSMLSALKRGDEVVTAGGIYGRIEEAGEDYLILDLGDTKVKVTRSAVSSVIGSSKIVEKKSKKGGAKEKEADAKSEPKENDVESKEVVLEKSAPSSEDTAK